MWSSRGPMFRLLIKLAIALSLIASPAFAVGWSQSSDTNENEQMVQRCRERWMPACATSGVPNPNTQPNVLACAVVWQPGCPGELETVQSLVRAGPSGVTYPTPLQFSARGFLQSGWPVVIKYRAPPGAIPTLKVKPLFGGGEPFRHVLPRSTDGSDQLYSFVAEVSGASGKVVVADYTVTARTEASNASVPVTILGIGAGPRAVGSIAIDQIRSDPPTVQKPTGNDKVILTFSYLLQNDWDLVSEDLWRDCANIGPFCNWSHPRNPYHPSARGRQTWQWTVTRRSKLGQYQLVIRAWHTCGAQVNLETYHQCGKQLDWVIGSAGPVFIR